jgi:hypothetical protein
MAITQPKVIQPKRNSNLNCSSSRYSHIPNIKSNISKDVTVEWLLAELWPFNLYFCSNFKLSRHFLDVLWYIDLIFGILLYLDLDIATGQISSQYINGRQRKVRITSNLNKKYKFNGHNSPKSYSTFFVQILSCPYFFLTSFDILT